MTKQKLIYIVLEQFISLERGKILKSNNKNYCISIINQLDLTVPCANPSFSFIWLMPMPTLQSLIYIVTVELPYFFIQLKDL